MHTLRSESMTAPVRNYHPNLTNEELKKELEKPCRICGQDSKGFHFGVVTCRACAAFFRRTVAESKTYLCRQNGTCPIRHERRNMCRACRFRKCESVGMNKNDVQLNRDSIKPVDNDDIDHNQRERSNPEEPSTSGPVAPEPVTHPEPILVRAIYPYDMEILNKMLDAYRSYQSCQRSLYAVQNPKKLTTSIDPEPANLSEYYGMEKGCVTLTHQMLVEHFDPFSSFPEDDRFKFLRHFYVPFSVVDQCYHSSMYFPNPNETRFYLHYKQYVDTRNLVEFFATEKNPEESAKFVSFLFVRTRRMINRFVDLKVSEMEAAALSGLLLWNVVTAHSTDNPIVEQKKDRIYFELHKLYTHLYGSEQTGIRFGKILSVASEIMEIARLSTESAFLSRIFDMTNERLDDVWPDL